MDGDTLENLVNEIYAINLVALDCVIGLSRQATIPDKELQRCTSLSKCMRRAVHEIGLIDGI